MSAERHHFIIPHISLAEEIFSLSARDLLHQLGDVLRLIPGEEIILGDGEGNEAMVRLNELSPKRAIFQILQRTKNKNFAKRRVILYCAVLKRDSFEWVVEKATEAGITEIVPLTTERTVKLGFNRERLEKIMREACEQSHRGVLPLLHELLPLTEALDAVAAERIFFFDFTNQQLRPEELASAKEIAIFIGPEGGWSGRERELAEQKGFLVRSLGQTVLRAETAATVATYLAAQF